MRSSSALRDLGPLRVDRRPARRAPARKFKSGVNNDRVVGPHSACHVPSHARSSDMPESPERRSALRRAPPCVRSSADNAARLHRNCATHVKRRKRRRKPAAKRHGPRKDSAFSEPRPRPNRRCELAAASALAETQRPYHCPGQTSAQAASEAVSHGFSRGKVLTTVFRRGARKALMPGP